MNDCVAAVTEVDASIEATVEPLRRLRAALTVCSLFNAGQPAAIAELVHPDVTVLSVPGVAPGAGYPGREGLLRYFAEAAEYGFTAHAAITEARVTQTGNVLACGKLLSTIDDVTSEVRAWFVYRFRDGLVSAIETYLRADVAREQAECPTAESFTTE